MCGRFLLTSDIEDLQEYYNIINEVHNKQYKTGEIFPSESPIVLDNKGFKTLKWGFPMESKLIINGRSETIFDKPMFAKAMEESRCIIPANSFYEWKNGNKYNIKVEGLDLFSFGGITKKFVLKDGSVEERFLILTTEANKQMEKIHHRMPLIIDRTLEKVFLEEKTTKRELIEILTPYVKRKLVLIPVDYKEQISFL